MRTLTSLTEFPKEYERIKKNDSTETFLAHDAYPYKKGWLLTSYDPFCCDCGKDKDRKNKNQGNGFKYFLCSPKKIGEDEPILTFKGVGSTTNYSHGTDRYSFHLSHLGVSGALLIGWMRVLVIPLERFPESDFGFATLSKASMGRTVYLPCVNG